MARKVFFSFDWDDVWRINQVRHSWLTKGSYENAGFIDSSDIEKVKKGTEEAIEKWIDEQLKGTSVTCVLIGSSTSESQYVNYEIRKSLDRKNGLLGVYIHNVKDQNGNISTKGEDPFSKPPMNFKSNNGGTLEYPCCSYYNWITDSGHQSLGDWIEKAAQQAGR